MDGRGPILWRGFWTWVKQLAFLVGNTVECIVRGKLIEISKLAILIIKVNLF